MSGSIYLRGTTWWARYTIDGQEKRESCKTNSERQAKRFLDSRLKIVGAHEFTGQKFLSKADREQSVLQILRKLAIRFEAEGKMIWHAPDGTDLIDLRPLDKTKPRKRAKVRDTPAGCSLRSLFKRAMLSELAMRDGLPIRALALTDTDVLEFITKQQRKTERLPNGHPPTSINRLTQLVGQAFRNAKLPCPEIPQLDESSQIRHGFFEQSQIEQVLANLPDDGLRDFVEFGYLSGWRKNEIASLTWGDVCGDEIRLQPKHSKNRDGRVVPLVGRLREIVQRRRKAQHVAITSVFHRDSQPIREFRKSWATACCMAGIGRMVCRQCTKPVNADRKCEKCGQKWKADELKYVGRTFHDLRRSCCRELANAGIPQVTIMATLGHKTDQMFRRYSIRTLKDQERAFLMRDEHLASQPAPEVQATERVQ